MHKYNTVPKYSTVLKSLQCSAGAGHWWLDEKL